MPARRESSLPSFPFRKVEEHICSAVSLWFKALPSLDPFRCKLETAVICRLTQV
jgi:hypothetical protein